MQEYISRGHGKDVGLGSCSQHLDLHSGLDEEEKE